MKRKQSDIKNEQKQTLNDRRNPLKIVLFGDSSIGKSTLFNKLSNLTDDEYRFPKHYCATDDFDIKNLEINTNMGSVHISLWDTAGQETKGGLLRGSYLKGADGILLLYDVSGRATISGPNTIDNLPKWLEQIKLISPNSPVAVLGNKADKFEHLAQMESVKLRECNLARDVGHVKIKNFLVSIKEDTHIEFISGSGLFSSTKPSFKEVSGCLIGLEYILETIYKKKITISY